MSGGRVRRNDMGRDPGEANRTVALAGTGVGRRPGFALMIITWQSWMAGRSFFFLLAFSWMIGPVVSLFVWRAAAAGGSVAHLSGDVLTFYYICVIVVNQFTMTQANWTVGDSIREGHINTQLLRPVHPLWEAAMSEVAGKGVFLLFTAPIAAVLAIVLRPEVTIDPLHIVVFVPAVLLAWLVRFLWGLWLALLAFRAARSDSLLVVQDTLLFLLAGVVAPVSLLPAFLQRVATVLPFRYMLGFPVEVLSGTLSWSEIGLGFAWQAAWLTVSALFVVIVWHRGVSRYQAVGG